MTKTKRTMEARTAAQCEDMRRHGTLPPATTPVTTGAETPGAKAATTPPVARTEAEIEDEL